MQNTTKYQPKNHIRIVTAAALFDGHDAAINIMRRLIQDTGVEVIHLGHNRSVMEIVDCAIQEDAHAIAITSYQGGHMEFFKYMYDLLREKNAGHIRIFGGGGGVILPSEIEELHAYGINRVFSPDDGRSLGLQGMINYLVQESDYTLGQKDQLQMDKVRSGDFGAIARLITASENFYDDVSPLIQTLRENSHHTPVVGITGTGGAGKSSLVDELVRRFLSDFPDKKIAILCVDPSRRRTGGALLGDRIRMNAIDSERVYMRSLATRQANLALSKSIDDALHILKAAPFDLILLETSGIGQSDTEVVDHSNVTLYVMTPEFGAPTQLEKIDMLDYADLVAINKFDKYGALDALRHVRKQFQRNRQLWDKQPEDMPVFSTMASQFNDGGVTALYMSLLKMVEEKMGISFHSRYAQIATNQSHSQILPPSRVRYLSEISETVRSYNKWAKEQAELANKLFSYQQTIADFQGNNKDSVIHSLNQMFEQKWEKLSPENQKILKGWNNKIEQFRSNEFKYKVRDREIKVKTYTETLSHLKIPKIAVPTFQAWGEILRWSLLENFPGEFPFAAGVFPFKREAEDPTRMFAGEGGPERTNKRFHYVSKNMPAVRLSTAFDSVTLYGEDPHLRPDIYGKIGNAGVSIACLDDAKKLYSGFDLAAATTSVSMTINGPAPIMTAYFMNVAIDQQCEKYIREHNMVEEVQQKIDAIYKARNTQRPKYQGTLPDGNNGLGLLLLGVTGDQVLSPEVYAKIKNDTLCAVRGTVQADILKEDQAQNTCIFSIDFSLKLMGDVQEYFIKHYVQNFYSVSISGYHIAEAGANPISQLAFTLANGFTYVEYYLARGMNIDDFAPNLSFFFSNGVDPEYSVIGRVARIIWAKAMKIKYKANDRSQKLKYHIQTSGRSLHAQEIEFNDIRTTLQALYAIYDNCNSLHTNAYDEAITTPTEDSVRRAMAIQMIINHELGLAKNQNPNQGSFIIEELTELVEEAVLSEFDRITERGGVLGAMENMYQRSKIQEESLYYESLKNNGKLPIMGVNTFLSSTGSPTVIPSEVIRSTEEEKQYQLTMLEHLHKTWNDKSGMALNKLREAALQDKNLFDELMETTKYCSLGQITHTLYEVGGQYRRNM